MLTSKLHSVASTKRRIAYIVVTANILYVLSFFIIPFLTPGSSHAEPSAELTTTLSISPSETASLELEPGAFNSTAQTIEVSTNNYTGYTLSLATNTNSTDLVSTSDNNLVISTIELEDGESSKTSDAFPFGYGYSVDGTHYKPAPGFTGEGNEQTAVSDIINSSDVAGTDTTTLTFGAKVEVTHPSGVYQNQFQLTATANDVGYVINYEENVDEGTVINMPDDVISTFNGTGVSVNIEDKIPNHYPYTFLGWSEDEVLDNESVLLQPGDAINLDPTEDNTITFYAQWEFRCHPDATTISNAKDPTILTDAICMQDMKLSVARDMEEEVQYTLYDKRDTKPYFISMLKDGNVWMTQNLDLGDSEKSYTLTSDDTDLAAGQTFVLPVADPDATAYNKEIIIETNGNVATATDPTLKDGGEIYVVPSGGTASDMIYESLEACIADNDLDTCRHHHVGNYYNIYAMSAGSFTPERQTYFETITSDTSICPAGWRLVTDYDSFYANTKSYRNLVAHSYRYIYGSSSTATSILLSQAPFYFTKSGYYQSRYYSNYDEETGTENIYDFDTALYGLGSYDYHITDTRIMSSGTTIYDYGSGLYQNTTGTYMELPIRCTARDNSEFELTLNYNYEDGTTPVKTDVKTYDSEKPHLTRIDGAEPTRNGYIFLGWATSEDATEPTYQPGDPIYYSTKTIPTTNQTINLYALWEESTNLLTTISTMQEMTPAICNGTTTPSTNFGAPTALLTDTRDNKQYWVAKLMDGNCWMAQNLNLGENDTSYTLTPENSDVAKDYVLVQGSELILNTKINNQFYSAVDDRFVVGDIVFKDLASCQDVYGNSGYCERYNTSNYYNYYTATAGTAGYDRGSGNAPSSICPLGWTIPDRTGVVSYQGVINQYQIGSVDTPDSFTRPLYFIRSGYGYVSDSGNYFYAVGNAGYFWSRNMRYTNSAYYINYPSTGSISTDSEMNKNYVLSVRCIARPNESFTLTYNANGGSNAPASQSSLSTHTGHADFTLSMVTPVRTGFTFKGWNTKLDATGDMYQPGEEYPSAGTTTLYATWEYNLVYDANGGTNAPATDTQIAGGTATFTVKEGDPVYAGKYFLGWSLDQNATVGTYYAGGKVTASTTSDTTTLYAIWADSPNGLQSITYMQEMNATVCT